MDIHLLNNACGHVNYALFLSWFGGSHSTQVYTFHSSDNNGFTVCSGWLPQCSAKTKPNFELH